MQFGSIRENNGAVAIDNRAIVDMETNAFGDGYPLTVATKSDKISGGVEVVHAFNLLFDDGPCI